MIFGLFGVWKGRKILCCVQWRKRRANKTFAVRFFAAVGKQVLCRAFFLCRAPYKKHTADKTFAVRPK
jgi:hypothetical protein